MASRSTPVSYTHLAKRLLEHGHSFVFAQPNKTDSYDVINEADTKDYIPIGMVLEIDGRKFVIDSVNFGADEVSLRESTHGSSRCVRHLY